MMRPRMGGKVHQLIAFSPAAAAAAAAITLSHHRIIAGVRRIIRYGAGHVSNGRLAGASCAFRPNRNDR